MSDFSKVSYYAIIPANVRYDKNVCSSAKLLYGEITALCNQKGFCWASNSYFAELYGVSKTSVSKWIKQLIDGCYIKSSIEYKLNTKEVLNRYLTIISYPIEEKLNTPIEEKLKDNTTSINTTFNNNTLSCKQDRTDNITKEVIDRLNDVAGTKYKASTSKTRTLIQARLKEGFSLEDFNRVIDKKCREWSNTEMAKYLRPETLFGTKFESYLNQPDAIAVKKDDYFSHGRLV